MKKKYIIPSLDIIKAQMVGAICAGSGENDPQSSPTPGTEVPTAAPRVV